MAIAGRVAIVPKGDWISTVKYDKLDLVRFGKNAYVAKKPSTNIEPTNTEYWMLSIEGGEGGEGGTGIAEELTYDNTGSGLTATNVQDAIDELASKPSIPDNFEDTVINIVASEMPNYLDDALDTTSENGIKNKVVATAIDDIHKCVLIFADTIIQKESWSEDTTYTNFPYKADISCEGVTADYKPDVVFDVAEATSGIYAPVASTGDGIVSIYASEIPSDAITIPSITCVKAVSV